MSGNENDIGNLVYSANVKELVEAPQACMNKRYWLSTAKLIYSGIDNLAWLSRQHNEPNVRRTDFIKWVNQYLLPDSNLDCTADELYGARCGLLHANVAESDRTRTGTLRQICYATGASNPKDAYKHIRQGRNKYNVIVHIKDLYDAYLSGIKKFNSKLDQDPGFASAIYERSNRLFAEIT